MGPMMYFAYRVGGWALNQERAYSPVDPSFQWFTNQLGEIWQPLIVGTTLCGIVTGVLGFLAVRLYFRWRVAAYKRRKRAERMAATRT